MKKHALLRNFLLLLLHNLHNLHTSRHSVLEQAYEAEFHERGGCEELYIRMAAAGINMSYERMWVPFSEWEWEALFQLPFKIVFWALQDISNSALVRAVWPFYWTTLSEVFEEIMIRFGFPLTQAVLPSKVIVGGAWFLLQ